MAIPAELGGVSPPPVNDPVIMGPWLGDGSPGLPLDTSSVRITGSVNLAHRGKELMVTVGDVSTLNPPAVSCLLRAITAYH